MPASLHLSDRYATSSCLLLFLLLLPFTVINGIQWLISRSIQTTDGEFTTSSVKINSCYVFIAIQRRKCRSMCLLFFQVIMWMVCFSILIFSVAEQCKATKCVIWSHDGTFNQPGSILFCRICLHLYTDISYLLFNLALNTNYSWGSRKGQVLSVFNHKLECLADSNFILIIILFTCIFTKNKQTNTKVLWLDTSRENRCRWVWFPFMTSHPPHLRTCFTSS